MTKKRHSNQAFQTLSQLTCLNHYMLMCWLWHLGLGLFDVIWSWKFENIHKLTGQPITHSRHSTMIKFIKLFKMLIKLLCKFAQNYIDQITLQMCSKWHWSEVKREMFSDSKCQDTSCHVQTLIWDFLNGPDQVVLFQLIGICVLHELLYFYFPPMCMFWKLYGRAVLLKLVSKAFADIGQTINSSKQ